MTRIPSSPPVPPPAPVRRARPGSRFHLCRMFVAAGAVALVACESADPPEPREVPIVGYIDFSVTDHLEPQIPKTATAGVPVGIAFWTIGGGCVQRIHDTEVALDRGSAVVTPYDILLVGTGVCTRDIKYLKHRATLVFDEPGSRRVVLRYSTGNSPKRDRTADGQEEYLVEVSPAG